jgi:hypothetical protein
MHSSRMTAHEGERTVIARVSVVVSVVVVWVPDAIPPPGEPTA